jgi:hypothetical protein
MFKKSQSTSAFRMPAFDVDGPREDPSVVELKKYEKVLVMKNKTRRSHGKEGISEGVRRVLRA